MVTTLIVIAVVALAVLFIWKGPSPPSGHGRSRGSGASGGFFSGGDSSGDGGGGGGGDGGGGM